MKRCMKFTIAGVVFSAMFALSPSNAFAECFDGAVCNTLTLEVLRCGWNQMNY